MDWFVARVAYDERTRGPVEFHRERAWADLFLDLVTLDALDRVRDLAEPEDG